MVPDSCRDGALGPGRQETAQKQVANSKSQVGSIRSLLDRTLINYIEEKGHWTLSE